MPEIQEVLDRVRLLLMNDLFLENYLVVLHKQTYCMLPGKHKDRAMIERPVDDKPEQNSFSILCNDAMMYLQYISCIISYIAWFQYSCNILGVSEKLKL